MTDKVFISYPRPDHAFAEALGFAVRDYGIAPSSIQGVVSGDNWERAIKRDIRAADAVIFVLSSAALNSAWVLAELGAAWAAEKPVIWVLPPNRHMPRDIPVTLREIDFNVVRPKKLTVPPDRASLRDRIAAALADVKEMEKLAS